uniref:Protein transport protein Sec31A n=1 Tax=Mastacembelus armatus TaxID=205130 RepID=A0A7N8YNW4_9TELE
ITAWSLNCFSRMKLKQINRTAIQSWSPAQHHPIYLATGTSAQQLDASFSTNASLELFELDLAEPSLDMKSCGSFSSTHRYHKLVWGPYEIDAEGHPSGVLIAGGENGDVILYDPAKIISGESDVIIAESDKHTGPVRALDVNPFQTNLVASGGNESEIYIWDMNNFNSPMTPGPKTQPLEDIGCVSWNRQVQHILASANPSGRASVWDLRKNDLIIKVSDHSNRMHCSGLAWNPEVATQLVLASEDDRMPVIQMWDLRFATSPLKILESHTRGVLSIAWSSADPELLLSCGKDSRILCWNPNTAEVLYELPTSSQWCFDIQWCPRNPEVLSAASFDGHIDIYSIMGGSSQAQSQRQADQVRVNLHRQQTEVNPLKKPPKWIRRPVGASFAFGGKLVSLENTNLNPQQPTSHVVHISQVVTETAFLKRSDQLQATLSAGSFVDFCQEKINAAENEFEKTIWSFLKANFESDVRSKYLELLGYNKEELALKQATCTHTYTLTELNRGCSTWGKMSRHEASIGSFSGVSGNGSTDVDGLITQALLTGDFEGAVELCLHDNRMADSIILAIAGGAELLEKTQKKYFMKTHSKITKLISAVVMKDWQDILKTCDLQNWKEALAAVMTYAQPEEFSPLCDLLGDRLEAAEDAQLQSQACLCYICAGNVEKLVSCWTKAQDGCCPLSLQDLVEKVVVLRRAVEQTQRSGPTAVGILLAEKMSHYANLLASQGSLSTAINYLPDNTNQVCNTATAWFTSLYFFCSLRVKHEALEHALCHICVYLHDSVNQYPSGAGGVPIYQPLQYFSSAAPPPPAEPSSPPHPPGFLSQYTQPIPSQLVYPGQPHANQCLPSHPSHSPFYPTSSSSFSAPPSSGVSFQHGGPGSPVSYMPLLPLSGISGTQLGHGPIREQPLQSIPAEKITKKPIPDEHLVLKTTFEGLIQKCLAVATDPQTKRKLDDAFKRLEALYDKLREQTLSPAIVGGLHNIARTIESRSYTEGLNIHTHIVSNSNFSETSAFMPVLKVVLTQANKLGV